MGQIPERRQHNWPAKPPTTETARHLQRRGKLPGNTLRQTKPLIEDPRACASLADAPPADEYESWSAEWGKSPYRGPSNARYFILRMRHVLRIERNRARPDDYYGGDCPAVLQ